MIVGLLLAVLSVWSVPRILPLTQKLVSTRHIGLVGRFTLADLPVSVLHQVSLGLTTLDDSGWPSPGLATSWIATDSGKTYIFSINQSLKWQDGSSLTSRDINYNFRDAELEYPSPDTLIIKLKDSFSPLPSVVSRPVLKTSGFLASFRRPRLMGLGSYSISGYTFNGPYLTKLTLSPVASSSNLPKLVYHFYSTSDTAILAFKMGSLDILENISDTDQFKNWPNLSSQQKVNYDRYVSVFFNTQSELFSGNSGKNLRLSLAYAIDKDRWPNRAIGPIPPTSWAFNPDVKTYDFSLKKSQELLEKVDQKPENITISTVPTYSQVAEQIKSDWSQLGIDVDISVSSEIPTDFQVLLFAQSSPRDPDQYQLWHSTEDQTNLSKLKNPRLDKYLEDGRKTWDREARKLIYMEFQKFLLEESPVIFLYYPSTYTISRS